MIQTSFCVCQTPATDPNYELYFSDEFNSFDPDTWESRKANFIIMRIYLHILWNYTKIIISMSIMEKLEVTIKHEHVACPNCCTNSGCSYPYYDYTSGWIESKVDFQYGYIEALIKFPDASSPFLPLKSEINCAFWTFKGTTSPSNT